MSDIAEKKLKVVDLIKGGVELGLKSIVPILVNALLWLVTCWIPYLNIGTTIGLFVGIAAKVSKGEAVSMTEIFNPQYRKFMGEFFLTSGLIGIGAGIGFAFFIIPGIVISTAWSLALLFTVDKGKNPTEAISLSNKVTYGNKATIFCASFIVAVAAGIVGGLLALIPLIGWLFALAVTILTTFVSIGIQAQIYRTLGSDI
ncbi:hypothetical protein FACS1894151_01720 [Spirochaetia bacterium]|nr:hypothetical protein FACS1894151_01720 [Spirochaetia bacterium]